MIDAPALLTDTKALVKTLVDDLRTLASNHPDTADVVHREHAQAANAGRTALAKTEWAEGLYAQVAVAWVLAGVFVRFCEDNGLVADPLLAGAGHRRAIALDHRAAYLQANPAHDDRHWLREIVSRYRALPATGHLFGDHNPIWLLAPSADGARTLIQKLQEIDPDNGEIRHDFTDPAWGTRFLGDLYQDLSDHAKKQYALLQTPEFVEAFLLDLTLEPAIKTYGLRDATFLDPACGSGHLVLGAFARLRARWDELEPGTNARELTRRAVDAVAGVDLNPFAVAIARFRLMLAALGAGGDTRLVDAPAYPLHLAVGDSLLHGDPPGRLAGISQDEEFAGAAAHGYAIEDVDEARAILTRPAGAVCANPPYITVKDPAMRELYRKRFKTCSGKYSLGVPFTERCFQLARNDADRDHRGFVGIITTNSFMKREFGKKLVEDWVPAHDLTHVIDTSGAYLPGHGTPTVILFGRNRTPTAPTVRAVMGIRGEPTKPADPAKGLVWGSITTLVNDPGSQSDYVSVVDLDRARLATHPWSIGGGGAAELKELLDERGARTLGDIADSIGITSFTLEDDAYLLPDRVARRAALHPVRPMVEGDTVRDWTLVDVSTAVFPYDNDLVPLRDSLGKAAHHWLWPNRCYLATSKMFGNKTKTQAGLHWTEYGRLTASKLRTPLSIVCAEIETHNHFVLDRGGKVFKQTAPIVKLPATTDEQTHLAVVGLLNSSTGSFWMKQVCHNKGRPGAEAAAADEPYEFRFVRDSTKLQSFPVPTNLDAASAACLDSLAAALQTVTAKPTAASPPTALSVREASRLYADLRAQMIAAQERLDWEVYRLYGLVDDDLTTGADPEMPLRLGERAFEVVLARRIESGEEESSWFTRHGSRPITELPGHWPDGYRKLVERRIELIKTDLNLGLIERPEHKRRWATKPWQEHVETALRGWLLERLEMPRYWPEPAALTTTARLAADTRSDAEFVQVAQLFAGRDDVDVAALVADLVKAEAVPYLAALRYSDSGLRKHEQWLETWALQRREDAGEDVGPIPVPPKYVKGDFTGVAWEHRGKLDVPKERFISYPGASRETDPSLVVGWAGWDHLARARALATWYLQARRDGRGTDHVTPLLAGLAELVPWVQQWHDDPNPDPALDRPGSQIAALLDGELRAQHLTMADLAAWRPAPTAKRGRARR